MWTRQGFCVLFLIKPGRSTPQNSICPATCLLSQKNIQLRQKRHVWPWWRSRDKLISDILLWTSTHGQTSVGRSAKTYMYQLCADTRCRIEDLSTVRTDRDGWWKRERKRERESKESGQHTSMMMITSNKNTEALNKENVYFKCP